MPTINFCDTRLSSALQHPPPADRVNRAKSTESTNKAARFALEASMSASWRQ
ncbi:hypothetical protein L917_14503 [Phytophthora nicotianae]|uniref:Uncharacterized protein n=2 Tax=Phytophthora nicotianae TaxID=4792 RepID=W2PU84_PHYN3|nr:hypothetical protein PPTG_23744 [Phytophthora nicotianae INRA-310]ETL86044.1 hypothetical protein L917_14503 [Phytophthora nicotianae]ETN03764.1 hypothetical protein PPTG_23744 [Phytophthora nicotianae INRA-310]